MLTEEFITLYRFENFHNKILKIIYSNALILLIKKIIQDKTWMKSWLVEELNYNSRLSYQNANHFLGIKNRNNNNNQKKPQKQERKPFIFKCK